MPYDSFTFFWRDIKVQRHFIAGQSEWICVSCSIRNMTQYKHRGSCQSAKMARLQQMNVGKISTQQRRAASLPVSRRASPSRSVHHSHQAYSSYSSSLKPGKPASQPSQNQKSIENNKKNKKNKKTKLETLAQVPQRGQTSVSDLGFFGYFLVWGGLAGWLPRMAGRLSQIGL